MVDAKAGTEVASWRDKHHRSRALPLTFIVQACKGEAKAVTVRLSVAAAIAKGRALLAEGWQVIITGPDGIDYDPAEFDRLLRHSRSASAESRSDS